MLIDKIMKLLVWALKKFGSGGSMTNNHAAGIGFIGTLWLVVGGVCELVKYLIK